MTYDIDISQNPSKDYLYYNDRKVSDNEYIIIRLDGKTFHKYTENMDKPFDNHFMSVMSETTKYLMQESGFKILFAESHSDEINILIDKSDNTFNRRIDKIISILSSQASAFMSKEMDRIAVFDAKIYCTDMKDTVVDYFIQRYYDAYRNFVNGHAYWTVKKVNDISGANVSSMLKGMSTEAMKEMLLNIFSVNLDNNDPIEEGYIDPRQLGYIIRWTQFKKLGHNPITNRDVIATRKMVEERNSDYDSILYFLMESIHQHHKHGLSSDCPSCKTHDGYCGYCKEIHNRG